MCEFYLGHEFVCTQFQRNFVEFFGADVAHSFYLRQTVNGITNLEGPKLV